MKIVAFSINPIFPDVVTGGASKHLFYITRAIGQMGHQVEILCAKDHHDLAGFEWTENVHVKPILPFHMPFPQPYAISGAELGLIMERVSEELESADRFYIHDGEFLLPDVYAQIPTVVSFRDNIYPETILGSFIGKADDIICVSGFSYDVIKATAGRFYPDLAQRMHLVNNGIDFDLFKPVAADGLAHQLGLNPQTDIILLHPHRPDPNKGLAETIRVVERLVHRHGLTRIKVLIPEGIASMVSDGEKQFFQQMTALMDELNVRENFRFIPWLPQEQMPLLYSLGQATLCLGNFVETFGNTAYESLACGTPSVVSKVGVHRTLLPDDLIDKIDYGDIDGAVERLLAILEGKRADQSAVLAYIKEELNHERQLSCYGEIVTHCEKRPPLLFSPPQKKLIHEYCLAPWCDMTGDRIYHDFRGEYLYDDVLINLINNKARFSVADLAENDISTKCLDDWLENTVLVSVEEELIYAERNKCLHLMEKSLW